MRKGKVMLKEYKGITLIALVITIIVLLILVGISISTIFGDNGIINKALQASFLTEYTEVQERVDLFNVDAQMINTTQENVNWEVFPLGDIITNEEKNSWQEEKKDLINQIEDNIERPIEETILYYIDFNKLDIEYKHKYLIDTSTGLLFCYDGHKYSGELHHIPDNIEKNSQILIRPEFEPVNEFPILKANGVERAGVIRINYSNEENYENYYSIDEGKNWVKYEGEFLVETNKTVYAKSVNTITGVEAMNSIKVVINPRGIALAAYDGSLSTYDNAGEIDAGYKYMLVDKSAVGLTVEAHLGWHYAQMLQLDENEEILYESDIPGVDNGKKTVQFEILEETKYLVLHCSNKAGDGALLYEIQIKNTPDIVVVQKAYPKLTSNGIEKPSMEVMLDNTHVKQADKLLYSKDNTSWQEYNGGEIRLEVGETIYAKNKLNNGEESGVVSQQCTIDSRAITEKAYDGSLSTYDNAGKINAGYKYMSVDSSAIGLTVEAHLGWYYAQILQLNENEEILYASDIPGVSSGKKTVQFEILEDTKYLVLYCSNSGGDGALLYEINLIS